MPTSGTIDLNRGLTVSGRGISSWIRLLNDPSRSFYELSRWAVNFDITKIITILRNPRRFREIVGAFSLERYPTMREKMSFIINSIFEFMKPLQSMVRFLLNFLWANKNRIILIGLVLLFVRMLIHFSNVKPYRRANVNLDPNHRPPPPPVVVPGMPNPVPVADLRAYPIHNQEEAAKLLKERKLIGAEFPHVNSLKCPTCRMRLINCPCLPLPGEPILVEGAALLARVLRINQTLEILRDEPKLNQFRVGETFTFDIYSNSISRWMWYFGINVQVDWKMKDQFNALDTRSTSEKHILPGNSMYWVIRQKNLLMEVKMVGYKLTVRLPSSALSFFGIPGRDLVVNEDHFRLNRRSSISDDTAFSTSLRGQMDTMLAVPINDPTFVDLEAHPLRDGYFVVRSFLDRKTPGFADFR